jgi:hypothetical protein
MDAAKKAFKVKKPKALPWEYCECGCKGHDLNIEDFYVWRFIEFPDAPDSYKEEKVYLLAGQMAWHKQLGRFDSRELCDTFVRELIKEHLAKRKGKSSLKSFI